MNTFKSILRSLSAVVAGYMVIALLTGLTISVLAAMFPTAYMPENTGWVLLNVAYSALFAVVGGYITARLAPNSPLWHTLALGILMALFSALTAVAVASAPADSEYARQPSWYYPALTVIVLPAVMAGYWIFTRTAKRMKVTLGV